MKVKFLVPAIVENHFPVSKGDVFEAAEEGNFITISFSEKLKFKLSKSRTNGVLEVVS